jgi:hypothetical protein
MSQPVMTRGDLEAIVDVVEYKAHAYRVGAMGDGYFVQLTYLDEDVETGKREVQHGRKWYVSRFSTRSEVVQTMLKAALTSAEHRVREHFRYRNARIFAPHFDVDALIELVASGKRDVRVPKEG